MGSIRKNTIIAGDFNSHHTTWNCANIDSNGENLLQTMYSFNFFCINRDTMTRINSPHERASNIDLIFVSLPAINLVTYKQLEDSWDSDHFPLLIEYKRGVECYRKRSNRWSTKCTDWDKYSNLVNSLLLETKNRCENEGRDITYANLVEIMYKAVNVATGRKEKQPLEKDNKNNNKVHKNNPVKWWDADCKKVIMERKQKLKTYLPDGSVSSFIEYKKSCAIVRRTIKTKKRECFKEFCNSINRWTGLSYVWKTVKILKNSQQSYMECMASIGQRESCATRGGQDSSSQCDSSK